MCLVSVVKFNKLTVLAQCIIHFPEDNFDDAEINEERR